MNAIQQQHSVVKEELFKRCWRAAFSIGITTIALAVILCACCCCMLPGVNALSQVVYPVIIPSLTALSLVIPLLWMNAKQSPAYITALDMLERELQNLVILDDSDPEEAEDAPPSPRVRALLNLLPQNSQLYSAALLSALKKRFPSKVRDQMPEQTALLKTIDNATRHLYSGLN